MLCGSGSHPLFRHAADHCGGHLGSHSLCAEQEIIQSPSRRCHSLVSHPSQTHAIAQADKNNVILITGCDSGIGRATSEKFLQEGYSVIATVFTDDVGRFEGFTKDYKVKINFFIPPLIFLCFNSGRYEKEERE